jgi:hypothetical protein
MQYFELFFTALTHIAMWGAVICALLSKTIDDQIKWQLWSVLFAIVILIGEVAK